MRVLLSIVSGLAAIALLSGCNHCSEGYGSQKTPYLPSEVIVHGGRIPIPPTATNIKYAYKNWMDSREFVYFRAPRQDADEFAKAVLSGIELEDNYRMIYMSSKTELCWWRKVTVPGARGAMQNSDGNGIREVLLVDHPGYSELWLYATDGS